MNKFRIAWLFLRLLSRLPLNVLYFIAGFLRIILQKIIHYRSDIVRKNISEAFPNLSEKEQQLITDKYYRYFANLLVENIKLIDLTTEELASRIRFTNPELLQKYYDEGRYVAAVAAHYGNWEWTMGLNTSFSHECLAIYKPLNNKYFNRKLIELRKRSGARLIPMRSTIRELLKCKTSGVLPLVLFIADQSPVYGEVQYWVNFLNKQTAVYTGPEKIAHAFNMVVIYLQMKPMGRGMYEVTIVPVSENPADEPPFSITDLYMKLIEETIEQAPEYWLWSHNRWKLTEKREREEKQGIYIFDGNYRKKNHA